VCVPSRNRCNEHFQKLGKSLDNSVEHYNKTLGSLERQLLPGAKRMTELGIQEKKILAELTPIEQSSRPSQVESPSAEQPNL